jgi:phosphoribosylformylglycinamidine synthase
MPTSRSAATPPRCTARCASSITHGRPTETYPFNPNGSPEGLTSVTTADGRFTVLMPHPERVFRNVQLSFAAGGDISALSPWMRMFRNARKAVG